MTMEAVEMWDNGNNINVQRCRWWRVIVAVEMKYNRNSINVDMGRWICPLRRQGESTKDMWDGGDGGFWTITME